MMRKLIEEVYGSEMAPEIEIKIKELVAKYDHKDRPTRLTQEDVLLITYGDQVATNDENKLRTLHNFLNNWVKDHITMVHILPFYPYSSDDGFSVIDYYEVNRDLGEWSDVQAFSGDFKLMFDGVINHISQHSKWLKKYLENDPEYKNYFVPITDEFDSSNVIRPRTTPIGYVFKRPNGNTVRLWTTFSNDQVDINFHNPKVFLHVLDILLHYVANGATAIRLDAIGFMWKKSGTTCIHLPEVHKLIQIMRLVLNQMDHETLLVTETNVPHLENISYFGNGENEAHMVYNFTLPPLMAYSLLTGNTSKLIDWATTLELPSRRVCFFNFLASHDGVGVRPVEGILTSDEIEVLSDSSLANGGRVSFKSNHDGSESPYEINCNYFSLLHGIAKEQEMGVKRMILAHMVMLSFPGLPAIYFHSLFGSQNDIKGMVAMGHNRSINREKFELNELEDELANDPVRSEIFHALMDLIRIRRKQAAFDPHGEFEFFQLENGLFGIKRMSSGDEIHCLFNFTDKTKQLPSFNGMHNLISGNVFSGELEPLQGVWCKA